MIFCYPTDLFAHLFISYLNLPCMHSQNSLEKLNSSDNYLTHLFSPTGHTTLSSAYLRLYLLYLKKYTVYIYIWLYHVRFSIRTVNSVHYEKTYSVVII